MKKLSKSALRAQQLATKQLEVWGSVRVSFNDMTVDGDEKERPLNEFLHEIQVTAMQVVMGIADTKKARENEDWAFRDAEQLLVELRDILQKLAKAGRTISNFSIDHNSPSGKRMSEAVESRRA